MDLNKIQEIILELTRAANDKYIVAGEAAKLLGVSKNRIYNLVNGKYLTAYYLPDSKTMRLLRSEVMALPVAGK